MHEVTVTVAVLKQVALLGLKSDSATSLSLLLVIR